jgi:hypothetical protein
MPWPIGTRTTAVGDYQAAEKGGLMGNGKSAMANCKRFPISHCPFAIQDAFVSILLSTIPLPVAVFP